MQIKKKTKPKKEKMLNLNQIIAFFKKRGIDVTSNEEPLLENGSYSGSFASIHDFRWIRFDQC